MKHLLLFTIGPVQSFIAQARKTQDLYAGSKILSDLIGFAMDKLETLALEKTNVDFIFPSQNTPSKPNRFIAIVNADKAKIKQIGDDLETAVMDEFATGATFGGKVNTIFDCEDQFRDFLKINWVAQGFDETPEKYKEEIATLERLMGAVKNTRQFVSFPEKGRKCAVNGEYNVRFYRKTKKETEDNIQVLGAKNKLFHSKISVFKNDDTRIKINNVWIDIKPKHLQQGEGVCGITLLKRYYDENEVDKFLSTSEVATLETLNILRASDTLIASKINQILKIDEQFIYDDGITDKGIERILENNGQKISKDYIKSLQTDIANAAKNYKVDDKSCELKLSKYYAILVFDADSMGKALQSADKTLHTNLSTKLGEFALWAKDTYFSESKGNGKAVYAGGDDFLGFVNLNYLFESLKDLREKFTDMVSTPLNINLSFSAGIAIAHYKTPLSEVLNYARAMEKKAKAIDGKNAFAIAVLKHSGEIHETVFKWTYEALWTTEVAKTLTKYLASKQLSDKFITNLSMEFESLINDKGELPFSQNEPEFHLLFEKEMYRLAERASKQMDKLALKSLVNSLFTVYEQSEIENALSLRNFLDFMSICEFIGRNLNFQLIPQPKLFKAMRIEITAFDTLFFRDGKPFEMGDDTWANGMFPPLPSVFYGALRSAYASQHNIDIAKIDGETQNLLIKGIYMHYNGSLLFPMPLDYVELKDEENKVEHLQLIESRLFTSKHELPYVSFSNKEVEQIADGLFDSSQMGNYIQGNNIPFEIKKHSSIISTENKVGIGRENESHIAKDSQIYRVAMRRTEDTEGKKLTFIVEYEFEKAISQDITQFFKLGAEGKIISVADYNDEIEIEKPFETNCFKLYLMTPAIFNIGNVFDYTAFFSQKGYAVKLLNAVIGKPFRVGGFDMKNKQPKEMKTAVPAGSVYYFEITTPNKTTLDLTNDFADILSVSCDKAKEGFGLYKICSFNLENLTTNI